MSRPTILGARLRSIRQLVWLALLLGLWAGGVHGNGQTKPADQLDVWMDEVRFRRLVVSANQLIYPRIAQAAGVDGSVRLRVTVQPDGTVGAIAVLRGHPMLDQAAIDSVAAWRFAPLVNQAQPVGLMSVITVNFKTDVGLSLTAERSREAREALELCEAAVREQRDEALASCKQADQTARGLPASWRRPYVIAANRGLAARLTALGRGAESLAAVDLALQELRAYEGFDQERVGLLMAQAFARTTLNDWARAAEACTAAVDHLDLGRREAGRLAAGFTGLATERAASLRALAPECAVLFERAGRPRDAERLRARARDLN